MGSEGWRAGEDSGTTVSVALGPNARGAFERHPGHTQRALLGERHRPGRRVPADEDGGTTISATLVPNPLGAMRLLRRSRAGGSAPSLGGRRHHHLEYTGAESSGRTYWS